MEYVSIRTSTLRGDQKLTFDVFVQVAGKHILYLRQGDSFEGKRLERLKQKKLKKMFIQPEHETLYRSYMTQNIESAYDKTAGKKIEDRADIIQGVQQSNVEAVLEEPESEVNYALAKEGASRYVEFLLTEDKAVQTMLSIENNDQDLAHHGVAVSTLAIAIANKIGVTQPAKTQMLALGALLHDFGHMTMTNIYQTYRPLKEWDEATRTEYQKHPKVGVDRVRDKRHFDQAVLTIILQHEELTDGSGYPEKLLEKDTDPLALIVSTANDFDRMMNFERLSRADAVKKFTVQRLGLHPLTHIQALKSII